MWGQRDSRHLAPDSSHPRSSAPCGVCVCECGRERGGGWEVGYVSNQTCTVIIIITNSNTIANSPSARRWKWKSNAWTSSVAWAHVVDQKKLHQSKLCEHFFFFFFLFFGGGGGGTFTAWKWVCGQFICLYNYCMKHWKQRPWWRYFCLRTFHLSVHLLHDTKFADISFLPTIIAWK